MKFNKRGQGLSVNAIILIVLGVVVLAILIAGFALGWGTLKDRIAPSNNVKTIVDSCGIACSINSQFDFCTVKREIKMDGDALNTVNINKKEDSADLDLKIKYSCKELLNYSSLGIQDCSSICSN